MESIGDLWKWLIGLGTAIIGFLSVRTLMKLDEENKSTKQEMKEMREKIHKVSNHTHQCDLELERFKTEVARDYIKRTNK